MRVPEAVLSETTEPGRSGADELRAADWLEVARVSPDDVAPLLLSVDRGEAETIVLARSIPAATLLLDDALGRLVARRLGLRIRGTIGVLLQAKEARLIASAREMLDALEAAGVFLGAELRAEALRLAQEDTRRT